MDNQKVRIYTKTGDKGETSLFGGKRIKKFDQRIMAIGAIDELNATLGVVASQRLSPKVGKLIEKIQNQLFEIGAELANPDQLKGAFELGEEKIASLEAAIDNFEVKLPPLKNFILPGGTTAGSLFHLARSTCRRAEREVVSLAEISKVNPNLIKYLNRLSDLLFVLARTVNKAARKTDKIWEKE
jgi:cob(I)alamin adenosyltransferase